MKLIPRVHKNNIFDTSAGKANLDHKLSATALNMGIAFEYGVNFKERTISLVGEIEASMFTLVDIALTEMEAQSKATITVRINSPGGSTYDAMAIIGRLKSSKCYIVTEGYGHVMSAATLILACGDRRRISKYAWFMHHEAAYEAGGRHSEIKNVWTQVEREEKFWAECLAQFTKRDAKFWEKTGISLDKFYSPQDLVEMGVADEVF
jgi:ATP-dependent protease ClpP protease subunit